MKIKKILSLGLASCMLMCTTPVYAVEDPVDGDLFTLGTPIDITTGSEVSDDLKAGQKIAIPMDVSTSTNAASTISAAYVVDTDNFTVGVVEGDLTDDEYDRLNSMGGFYAHGDYYVLLNAIGTSGRRVYSEIGAIVAINFDTYGVDEDGNNLNYFCWGGITDGNGSYTFTDAHEFYILLTVKNDVSILNRTPVTFKKTTAADIAGGKGQTEGIKDDSTKSVINACAGAFKLTIDNDAVAKQGYWITGITAVCGSNEAVLTEYTHEDGTSTYVFPARVLTYSGTDTSAEVTIKATTNTKEDGSGTAGEVTLATIPSLSLNGTVNDYTAAN